MSPMEEEYHEAERELQRMGWEALERCHKAGAKAEDVILLAKLSGFVGWKPNADARATSVG